MKKFSYTISARRIRNSFRMLGALLVLIAFANYSVKAANDPDTGSTQTKVYMSLQYFNNLGGEIYALAKTEKKVKGRREPIENLNVNFYLGEAGSGNLIGSVKTDENGKAKFILNKVAALKGKTEFTLVAQVDSSAQYEEADADVSVKAARLVMTLTKKDTVKTIHVMVTGINDDGQMAPVPETSVNFYVQRSFGKLPFGGDYTSTDDSGRVSAIFPNSLPGDTLGNVTLIAMLKDNDDYGNVIVEKKVKWGHAADPDYNAMKYQLWSTQSYPPNYLLTIIVLIVLGVWGTIVYVITQFFKIKKLGKVST